MIAFIFALNSEAKPILDHAENLTKQTLCNKICYTGKLFDKECIFAISGIGKVSAALTTQIIIDKFSPEYVLNVGTCGGTNNNVKVLNYYLVENCCQFDFDIREIDNVPLGYIQEYDRVYFPAYTDKFNCLEKVNLASSDRFSSAQIDIDNINQMGCSIRDMEGGAIAQVCLSNNVKYIGLKGVTDVYGLGTDGQQFYENLQTVVNGFPQVVKKIIDIL